MSGVAGAPGRVRAENVWKRFFLDGTGGLIRSLLRASGGDDGNALWALRDVSFRVEPGEAFGVVGSNGAGKSTMLKLLAGIMKPTRGTVEREGRLSCLIEVGAGFHPELTGRENVVLNGVILGMSRREVRRQFDSIVAFAGVEPFLDVPVKRYSSGMFMRLGFAVAVHATPQILLVDEVMAVGDHAFQRKCLDTVADLRAQGTAVVLVSHNFFTVIGTCSRGLWLERGQVRASGEISEVVSAYERSIQTSSVAHSDEVHDSESLRFVQRRFVGLGSGDIPVLEWDVPLRAELVTHAREKIASPVLSVGLSRADGLPCAASNTRIEGQPTGDLEGRNRLLVELPMPRLVPGNYRVTFAVSDANLTTVLADVSLPFRVASPIPNIRPEDYGVFILPQRWTVQSLEEETMLE